MNGFKITEQGDIVDKIYKYRDNYHKKGMFLGWEQLHKHYSMTLGNCTDWTGYPMSGKTQVLMELLVTLLELEQTKSKPLKMVKRLSLLKELGLVATKIT